MNELANNISNPAWWFSTVLVGVLINLASPRIQSLLSKITARSRRKAELQQERDRKEYSKEVASMIASSNYLQLHIEKEFRHRHRATAFFLFSVTTTVMLVLVKNTPQSTLTQYLKFAIAGMNFFCIVMAIANTSKAARIESKTIIARRTIEAHRVTNEASSDFIEYAESPGSAKIETKNANICNAR